MSWLRARESPAGAVGATRMIGALVDPQPQAAMVPMTMMCPRRAGCANATVSLRDEAPREPPKATIWNHSVIGGGAQESNLRLGTGERADAASGWPPKLPKRFGFWRLSWRRLLWRSPEVCGDGRSARHRG